MEIRHSHRQELAQGSPEDGGERRGLGEGRLRGLQGGRGWKDGEWEGERMEGKRMGGGKEGPKAGMWLWEPTSPLRLPVCPCDDIRPLGEGVSRQLV